MLSVLGRLWDGGDEKQEHKWVIETDVCERARKFPAACLSVTKRRENTWVMGWEGPVQTSSLPLSCLSAKTTTLFTQTNTIIARQPWPLLRLPLHANGPRGRQTPRTSTRQPCQTPSRSADGHQWSGESPTHLQRAQTPRIFQRLITIITRWRPSIHLFVAAPSKGYASWRVRGHTCEQQYTHTCWCLDQMQVRTSTWECRCNFILLSMGHLFNSKQATQQASENYTCCHWLLITLWFTNYRQTV